MIALSLLVLLLLGLWSLNTWLFDLWLIFLCFLIPCPLTLRLAITLRLATLRLVTLVLLSLLLLSVWLLPLWLLALDWACWIQLIKGWLNQCCLCGILSRRVDASYMYRLAGRVLRRRACPGKKSVVVVASQHPAHVKVAALVLDVEIGDDTILEMAVVGVSGQVHDVVVEANGAQTGRGPGLKRGKSVSGHSILRARGHAANHDKATLVPGLKTKAIGAGTDRPPSSMFRIKTPVLGAYVLAQVNVAADRGDSSLPWQRVSVAAPVLQAKR